MGGASVPMSSPASAALPAPSSPQLQSNAIQAERAALARPLEVRLRSFYLRHNPEKLEDVAKVARLFVGKEDELNSRLRSRYDGLDLTSLSIVDDDPAVAATASSTASSGSAESSSGEEETPVGPQQSQDAAEVSTVGI